MENACLLFCHLLFFLVMINSNQSIKGKKWLHLKFYIMKCVVLLPQVGRWRGRPLSGEQLAFGLCWCQSLQTADCSTPVFCVALTGPESGHMSNDFTKREDTWVKFIHLLYQNTSKSAVLNLRVLFDSKTFIFILYN